MEPHGFLKILVDMLGFQYSFHVHLISPYDAYRVYFLGFGRRQVSRDKGRDQGKGDSYEVEKRVMIYRKR